MVFSSSLGAIIISVVNTFYTQWRKNMARRNQTMLYDVVRDDLSIIRNIYNSFEALEETLGTLKLEEPLFMTYAAKKSFARIMMRTAQKKHNLRN